MFGIMNINNEVALFQTIEETQGSAENTNEPRTSVIKPQPHPQLDCNTM